MLNRMKNKNKLTSVEAKAVASALANIVKTLPSISEGEYVGNVAVSVNYRLTKAADGEAMASSNILSDASLAKALVAAKLSPQQEGRFLAALARTAKKAMLKDVPAADLILAGDKRVLSQIERVKAKVVAKLPKVPKAGAARVVAEVVKLDLDRAATVLHGERERVIHHI